MNRKRKQSHSIRDTLLPIALLGSLAGGIVGYVKSTQPESNTSRTVAEVSMQETARSRPDRIPYRTTADLDDRVKTSNRTSAPSSSAAKHSEIIASTNSNLRYAQNNVDTLRKKGYDSTLETLVRDGKTVYRTIVRTASAMADATLRGLQKNNYTGAFFKENKSNSVDHYLAPEYPLYVDKNQYLRGTSAYMQWLTTWGHGEQFTPEKSRVLASYIYDAAKQRGVSPILLTAVSAKENAFRNGKGDLNLRKFARGHFQMREPALLHAIQYGKAKKIPGLPAKIPPDFTKNSAVQCRFAAHYLGLLYDVSDGDLTGAVRGFNGGPRTQDPDTLEYARDVFKYASSIDDAIANPKKYDLMVQQRKLELAKTKYGKADLSPKRPSKYYRSSRGSS